MFSTTIKPNANSQVVLSWVEPDLNQLFPDYFYYSVGEFGIYDHPHAFEELANVQSQVDANSGKLSPIEFPAGLANSGNVTILATDPNEFSAFFQVTGVSNVDFYYTNSASILVELDDTIDVILNAETTINDVIYYPNTSNPYTVKSFYGIDNVKTYIITSNSNFILVHDKQ